MKEERYWDKNGREWPAYRELREAFKHLNGKTIVSTKLVVIGNPGQDPAYVVELYFTDNTYLQVRAENQLWRYLPDHLHSYCGDEQVINDGPMPSESEIYDALVDEERTKHLKVN